MSSNLLKLILLFFVGTFFLTAGTRVNPESRTSALRADLDLLKKTIEEKYPFSDRSPGFKKIGLLIDSCANAMTNETTDLEFYRTIKFVLSAMKDGHLSCSVPASLKNEMSQRKFFPLPLYFKSGKIYVTQQPAGGIPAGAEILSINGRQAEEITKTLFRYIVSDGNIEAKKYRILAKSFHFYYFLVYGEEQVFTVTYRFNEGKQETTELKAVPETEITRAADENEDKLLKLVTEGRVAVMTIKTFDLDRLEENRENFPSFLEQAFATIKEKKADRLIIDLRGNGGGRDLYGALLYSYLSGRAYVYYRSLEAATDSLPYERFTYPETSYNNLNPGLLRKIASHRYLLKKEAHANLGKQKPAPHSFKGKVWVLTDGLTYSTASEFCAMMKSRNRAVFIGEETGGGYDENTCGYRASVILPNTGISVSYGLIRYLLNVKPTGLRERGVLPDHPVSPTASEIISRQDVQMSYAKELAKKGK